VSTRVPAGRFASVPKHLSVRNLQQTQPRHPDDTKLASVRKAVATGALGYCTPHFKRVKDTSWGPPTESFSVGLSPGSWAGAAILLYDNISEDLPSALPGERIVIDQPGVPGNFGAVQANWVVPNVGVPRVPGVEALANGTKPQLLKELGLKHPNFKCAVWVGFGGNPVGHHDFLGRTYLLRVSPTKADEVLWQGGSQSDIDVRKHVVTTYSWFQVLGPHGTGTQVDIGFDISPGDLLEVIIKRLDPPSNYKATDIKNGKHIKLTGGRAHCVYTNWSRSTFTEFIYTCYDQIAGRSVEWIVERNGNAATGASIADPQSWLPRFGSIYFSDSSYAYRAADGQPYRTVDANVVQPEWNVAGLPSVKKFYTQTDSVGNTMCDATYLSNSLLRVDYVYELDEGFVTGAPPLANTDYGASSTAAPAP
jgi:hypothetical protein